MKKILIISATVVGILVVLALTYCIGSGFTKISSVYVDDYSLSEDGKEITLKIGVASSVGYVRKIAIHQQYDGKMYLDCYSAFGGINGSIGAKSVYTLPLDKETTAIAICRENNAYGEVLNKDINGEWQRTEKANFDCIGKN